MAPTNTALIINIMLIAFVLAIGLQLLTIPALSTDCVKLFKTGSTKIANFETGHFYMTPTEGMRHNWYTVQLQEAHNKERLGVTLSIIYISNYRDPEGVDFLIKPVVKDTFFDVLFVLSPSIRWVRTHVHYIASSRSDIVCGTFFANEPLLFEPTNNKTRKIRLAQNVQNTAWASTRSKIVPYTFISGIKVQGVDFSIKINDADSTFINSTLYTSLTVRNTSKPIQVLQISYFAFEATGKVSAKLYPAEFDFLYSTLSNNTIDDYGMNGMTAINGPSIQQILQAATNSRRMLTQLNKINVIDQLSISEINLFKRAFGIQELDLVSNQFLQPILRSTLVPPNLQKMLDSNVCISYDNCITNSGLMVIAKDGQQSCVFCPPGKKYSSENEQCQCLEGYLQVGDKCVLTAQFCGSGGVFINGSCFDLVMTRGLCDSQLNLVYQKQTNKCVCVPGFSPTTNSSTLKCINTCPDTSTYDPMTQQCLCPKDHYMAQNKCISCGPLQQYNTEKKQCQCRKGTILTKSGVCLICSPFAKVNQDKGVCECSKGYIGNGVICRFGGGVGVGISVISTSDRT